MNRKCLWSLIVLLLPAGPAQAFFFNSGVKQSVGTHNYSGTSLYADFGGDVHIRPSFTSYHSDDSSGTYKTISARLGYDTKLWGVGVTGGGTPRVNGYSNRFFGADAVVSLTPTGSGPVKRIKGSDQGGGAARGKGLARVDLGAGILHTTHTDEFQAGGARRARSIDIGQTDLNASVGVSVLKNLISADVTKSFYNKDLSAVLARGARAQSVQGLSPVIQGFPKTSVNLRLEMSMLPLVTPYVGYTRTTFELSQPAANAYSVGGYVEFEILEVSASFQRYVQSGRPDQNYYGLGASLRF